MTKPYKADWQRYRWLRLGFVANFLGGIPAISFVQRHVAETAFGWLFPATGFAWLLFFAVTAFRMASFPCPRCRKAFFEASWFTNRCCHCGLPKWHESDSTSPLESKLPA